MRSWNSNQNTVVYKLDSCDPQYLSKLTRHQECPGVPTIAKKKTRIDMYQEQIATYERQLHRHHVATEGRRGASEKLFPDVISVEDSSDGLDEKPSCDKSAAT